MNKFTPTSRPLPQLAIDCEWLRRTIDSNTPHDPFRMLCTHIVREGQECIGPFLEDMETDCRLWEPGERAVARHRRIGL